MNLHGKKPRPVLKRQLDCLTEEDEDVDYPPPRPITGLPEPISVDDNDIADKPISKNTEVSFSKAPCLQFTTEEIRNYIEHLQSKLDMLYLKIYEINRELIAVETEQIDDKHRIRNQQHILHQQEEELIFYRKFYQTGKNHANEENKQLKTPPKSEINKYSFGRKLNIETDPMDVDPDIKQVVDQRVQFVLEKHANEHISSPSPDKEYPIYQSLNR